MDTETLITKMEEAAKTLRRDGVLYHIADLLDEGASRLLVYKQLVDAERSAEEEGTHE